LLWGGTSACKRRGRSKKFKVKKIRKWQGESKGVFGSLKIALIGLVRDRKGTGKRELFGWNLGSDMGRLLRKKGKPEGGTGGRAKGGGKVGKMALRIQPERISYRDKQL